jgi:uncharacterized protein (TIGR00251 family)
MIELQPHAEGVLLPVRVQPGARREGIVGEHAGAIKIAVHAAPEQGKANHAVIDVLAKALDIPRGALEVVSGETSRQKRLLVRGLDLSTLAARLVDIMKSS